MKPTISHPLLSCPDYAMTLGSEMLGNPGKSLDICSGLPGGMTNKAEPHFIQAPPYAVDVQFVPIRNWTSQQSQTTKEPIQSIMQAAGRNTTQDLEPR
jgi:hypothetical protein